jgi:hypothetical protein
MTGLADPIYPMIEAYEKARAVCKAASAESDRLYNLGEKLCGKAEVTVPDLRGPEAPAVEDRSWLKTFEQDGKKYATVSSRSSLIEVLPGDANKALRDEAAEKLAQIYDAQKAVHGCDIDDIIAEPAANEWHAIGELVETVPTTVPGFFAMIHICAEINKRDPDAWGAYGDVLVTTLDEAATALRSQMEG